MANKLQKGMQDFGIKQALKYLEKIAECSGFVTLTL